MATPPTRVSYNAPATGNYSSTATSRTTPAFDVTAGDIIVVVSSIENGGAQSVVTPSASGGSVTWTQRVRVPAASNANTSGAWCWTGEVGATATGITVTVARPSTDTSLWWGMSATVYRGHGGVGVAFSGTNGTGANSAPSVTATCSANSAVQCNVNDWNAADGASRTWRTINGAAESETSYFRDASRHTVYGGYRTDTGAAGSVTQGLTAPTGQRWVLAGVEILGASGATNYNGTAASSSIAASTAGGVVGKVASVALAAAVAITTAGVVGTASTSTTTSTTTISAAGSVGASSGASLAATGTLAAAGTVTSGTSASASIAATGNVASVGVVGRVSGSSLTATATATTGGAVGSSAGASLSAAGVLSAAGTVTAAGSSSATVASTGALAAAGVVGRSAGASLGATGTVTAAGATSAGPNASASLAASGDLAASGRLGAQSTASIDTAAQAYAAGAVGIATSATFAMTASVVASGVVVDPSIPSGRILAVRLSIPTVTAGLDTLDASAQLSIPQATGVIT